MIGEKEFHSLLDTVKQSQGLFSLPQLEQLCKETQFEMSQYVNKNRRLELMMFFERYYTLNWDYLQLLRMGTFIKSGGYRKVMDIYGK